MKNEAWEYSKVWGTEFLGVDILGELSEFSLGAFLAFIFCWLLPNSFLLSILIADEILLGLEVFSLLFSGDSWMIELLEDAICIDRVLAIPFIGLS